MLLINNPVLGHLKIDQKQNLKNDKEKFDTLLEMRDLAIEMGECLKQSNIDLFGELLNKNWNLKKTLSNKKKSLFDSKY